MSKPEVQPVWPPDELALEERDFAPRYDPSLTGAFLKSTSVEVLREPSGRGRYRHILFDFDGTLSLIRAGWTEVMVEMMVEILLQTPGCEAEAVVREAVTEFVARLTGKQTIYQMMRLAAEVRARGGDPLSPAEYKRIYLDRLMARIEQRREGLRTGRISNEELLVPGSLEVLEELTHRDLKLYLASGTDEHYVKEEAGLLGIAPYFGEHIYGARDDYRNSSKAAVIDRILRQNDVDGGHLLGFGDGYVEIENVKAVGGGTVGVASDEHHPNGSPDPWKRKRLVAVGADVIVPDYRDARELVGYLMCEEPVGSRGAL